MEKKKLGKLFLKKDAILEMQSNQMHAVRGGGSAINCSAGCTGTCKTGCDPCTATCDGSMCCASKRDTWCPDKCGGKTLLPCPY